MTRKHIKTGKKNKKIYNPEKHTKRDNIDPGGVTM